MGYALHDLGIDSMSVDERITLVQEIWDSVAADAGLQSPSAAERAELDRRIAEDDAAPGDVTAWETIKAEAQSRWQR
jgi:putative addiction module component (TIGR02574 family)